MRQAFEPSPYFYFESWPCFLCMNRIIQFDKSSYQILSLQYEHCFRYLDLS